jgi:hypothetical protein
MRGRLYGDRLFYLNMAVYEVGPMGMFPGLMVLVYGKI